MVTSLAETCVQSCHFLLGFIEVSLVILLALKLEMSLGHHIWKEQEGKL
jgi:hypothetical protein